MKRKTIFGMTAALILPAVILLAVGCPKKEATPPVTEPPPTAEVAPPVEAEVEEAPPAAVEEAPPAAVEEAPPPEEAKIPDDKAEIKITFAKKPKMAVATLTHKKHAEEYGIACKDCHHKEVADMTCRGCHGAKKGPAGEPSFKDALHKNCMGCHKAKKAGPIACAECHKK